MFILRLCFRRGYFCPDVVLSFLQAMQCCPEFLRSLGYNFLIAADNFFEFGLDLLVQNFHLLLNFLRFFQQVLEFHRILEIAELLLRRCRVRVLSFCHCLRQFNGVTGSLEERLDFNRLGWTYIA